MVRNKIKLSFFTVVFIALPLFLAAKPEQATGRGQSATGQSDRVFIPIIKKRIENRTPIFGVQTYAPTREQDTYTDLLGESGTTWIRQIVRWSWIEESNTDPENYTWDFTDAYLAGAQDSRFQIIGNIVDAPAWAAPSPGAPIYPGQLDEFVEMVQALVERYDGDGKDDAPGSPVVNHWEIYNEPDRGADAFNPGWGDDGDAYAEMLQAVYPAVKAANPGAQVIFGGIAYDWFRDQLGPFVREFLDEVLASGGGDYFDVMSFHVYPVFAVNWTNGQGPGLYEKAAAIRAKLAEFEVSKPVIVTESGWHSNNPPSTPGNEEMQARYVVQLFTQSLAAEMDVMIWWMFYDPGEPSWDNGLVTQALPGIPPTRKPSYFAFRTIVEEMRTAHYARTLTAEETGDVDMEVHLFDDWVHSQKVYVAWINPVESELQLPLQIPGNEVNVTGLYGNTYSIDDAADGNVDGWVTVPVGSQPAYLRVNQ